MPSVKHAAAVKQANRMLKGNMRETMEMKGNVLFPYGMFFSVSWQLYLLIL